MLLNPYSYIISSNIKEKLYKGVSTLYGISKSKNIFFFDVAKIEINYTLNNILQNRVVFYTFLLLMEKLSLVRHKFISMKKTIASFNIRKGLVAGASYSMYSYKKDRFLHMFVNYSLNKLNSNFILNISDLLYEKSLLSYDNYFNFIYINKINFGINKFLFHGILSSNDIDYEFFLPILQHYVNGMNVNFIFYFKHFLINRLILSHYNITIY